LSELPARPSSTFNTSGEGQIDHARLPGISGANFCEFGLLRSLAALGSTVAFESHIIPAHELLPTRFALLAAHAMRSASRG
jgi:hypothetical protein